MEFYQKLGFEVFIPGIPYLKLRTDREAVIPTQTARALGLPEDTKGRACIMQLHNGLPKLDLTELSNAAQRSPLGNSDRGLVRICLVSQNLDADYVRFSSLGVEFLTPPVTCVSRMTEVAVCRDPEGTLIELLQVHLERWPQTPPATVGQTSTLAMKEKPDQRSNNLDA